MSQATQSLLEDEEEELAVGMRDLGDQRLKDIERPVRLYQVAAPGLRDGLSAAARRGTAEEAPEPPRRSACLASHARDRGGRRSSRSP